MNKISESISTDPSTTSTNTQFLELILSTNDSYNTKYELKRYTYANCLDLHVTFQFSRLNNARLSARKCRAKTLVPL